jgi:hypothetical protein
MFILSSDWSGYALCGYGYRDKPIHIHKIYPRWRKYIAGWRWIARQSRNKIRRSRRIKVGRRFNWFLMEWYCRHLFRLLL